MSGILSIGKSAMNAAQIGLTVTGHNIANANTAGYSRQVVVQSAGEAQRYGFGFVGQGANVSDISRIYNEVLVGQVVSSQASNSSISTYDTQLKTINNMLSDPSAGINPALNEFFAGIQDLTANPGSIPARQSMLSNAQSLVNRLQSTNSRLNEIRNGVNTQLTSSARLVNVYSEQIANLNDTIEKTVSAGGTQPNDLLDQRDQLVLELSKQIKTTVVPQGQGSYNIYIGNGLPLVVGATRMTLTTTGSLTDPTQLEMAYQSNGKTTTLGISSLPGGTIGGLLQFRAESLDATQNQIGQISVALASNINNQHALGVDLYGNAGGNFFNFSAPAVNANSNNLGSASMTSSFTDAQALTSSDYRLQLTGGNYQLTRLSDNKLLYDNADPAMDPANAITPSASLDGLSFAISGSMAEGDEFIIRPTRNVAATLSISIDVSRDVKKLAIGASSAPGDNKNGLLLAELQSASTLNNGSTSYSEALGQLINTVGNKSRELKVLSAAETQVLEQNIAAVQAESGVNLDEEATNLIRYQQAYQAAGKMMQIASQLFDSLLQIG